MADFRFYKTAREELEDIWFYTLQEWSEKQANKYLAEIFDCLQGLADKEKP